MEKQRERKEIEEKYKWDLTTIFKTDEEFLNKLEEVTNEIEKYKNFKGKILDSADTLFEYLSFDDELTRKLYKLYYYAHLNIDSDTTNTKYQEFKGKIDNLFTKYSEETSFVNSEMYKKPFSLIKKYLEENQKLKKYQFNLEQFYRYENHKLTEEQEKILSTLSNSLDISNEAYEALTDSDMKFGAIKDEAGKDIELTESNYGIFLHSNDRNVRKNAFERIYETYSNFKNTISTTFKGNVEYLTSMAKLRNFNSSLEASLFSDSVTPEIYNNLIDTVSKNMDVIYKYFDLKKEILNLDELHLYDIYVELIKKSDKNYTFLEAKDTVINALSILGEDYISNIKRAFDERWIDVYNNVGKRGGAYSSGFYDTNPFVLLNFEGKLNDVSTLAHELGHSMHTYYSCKNNTYNNSSYKIFVAEVASTVNEMLLNHYLLENSNDKNEKLYILNNMLELFRATIYRQVIFAEFERDMHALKEKGEILTNELLSNEYYKLNLKYFGENVVVDDLIRYEWMRVPHFYYNFYVYKYAIGLSCACYIVDGIVNKKENALENYLKFLTLGGSDTPVNELKVAGIDVTKSEVIESAIKKFDETIEEFKKLYNS